MQQRHAHRKLRRAAQRLVRPQLPAGAPSRDVGWEMSALWRDSAGAGTEPSPTHHLPMAAINTDLAHLSFFISQPAAALQRRELLQYAERYLAGFASRRDSLHHSIRHCIATQGLIMLSYALLCRESLEFAERYLAGFDAPRALVTGNHDLEGEDFDTDEANLAAWRQVGLDF